MKKEIVSKRRQYVKENIIRKEIREIANEWGVHISTIEKDLIYLRTHEGLKSKSELRDERILKLYKQGVSIECIAADICVTKRDVYYRLQKYGAI